MQTGHTWSHVLHGANEGVGTAFGIHIALSQPKVSHLDVALTVEQHILLHHMPADSLSSGSPDCRLGQLKSVDKPLYVIAVWSGACLPAGYHASE